MSVGLFGIAFFAMIGMMLIGLPIAVVDGAGRHRRRHRRLRRAFHGLDRAGGLGRAEREPADLDPAVRAARRTAAALGHRRPHVHRAVGLARAPARRPAAHQHRQLRAVRRDLGLVGGHRGHGRHGGAAVAAEARLFDARLARLAGGRRHARHPDPAERQHDRLRLADQHLDRQAVHRRHHPRAAADRLLHAVDLDLQRDERHGHARGQGAAGRAPAHAAVTWCRRWWCSAS